MRIDEVRDDEVRLEAAPTSLCDALCTTVGTVRAEASALRGALAQRDLERAWAAFSEVRRVLQAHLHWEEEDLPGLLDSDGLLDLPGETRTMRAWHELLIDALTDLEAEISESRADPIRAIKKADHAAARLVAFCEDYQTDLERGYYRTMDEDVERHDREPARRVAMGAWSQRMAAPRRRRMI